MASTGGPAGWRLAAARPLLRSWPWRRGRWRLASLLLFGSPRGGGLLESRLVPHLPDVVIDTRAGVRLRVRHDSHYLSPFLFGDYEPESGRVLRAVLRAGDVVLDVGANIGWYASLFGRAVGPQGRVIAFEPLPAAAAEARATVALNELGNRVEVVQSAVGAEAGELVIHTFAGLPAGHASASDLGRPDAEPHTCPVVSLDAHLEGAEVAAPALIKVDVEGFEREVFQGAAATLAGDAAPLVHFEINQICLRARGLTPEDTFAPLRAAGYDALWRLDDSGPVALAEPDAAGDGDYLAAKGERARRLAATISGG